MARILVVDDQKATRLSVTAILGEADHEVRAAAGGEEGLDVARDWRPDVVILDVHLPGMDGFDVVAGLAGTGSKFHIRCPRQRFSAIVASARRTPSESGRAE